MPGGAGSTALWRPGNLKSGDGGRRTRTSLWAHPVSRGYRMLKRGWGPGIPIVETLKAAVPFADNRERGPVGAEMPLIKRSLQGWPHSAHTAAFEETAPSASICTTSIRTVRATTSRGRGQYEVFAR